MLVSVIAFPTIHLYKHTTDIHTHTYVCLVCISNRKSTVKLHFYRILYFIILILFSIKEHYQKEDDEEEEAAEEQLHEDSTADDKRETPTRVN